MGPKGENGVTGQKGEAGTAGQFGPPGPPGEFFGATADLSSMGRPMGDGAASDQPQQEKRRRRKNRKNKNKSRRRRSAEPADIEDDLDSVTSKLMDKQTSGLEVHVGELIHEVSGVMLHHIDVLKKEVDAIRYPVGSRDNPAISCREIKLGHPAFKTGWYWVDPNLGSIDDAIQVWCNMTTSPETCVHPTQRTKMSAETYYEASDKEKTFKNMKDGFEIKYASSIQLDFLRLLSERTTQRFTYHCSGSAAWYDLEAEDENYQNAISLIGANDFEFETEEFTENMVIHDGCRTKDQNGFTTFEITTRKVDRLPIVNFRPKDYGEPWQKFGFEAGPICFY